MKINEKLALLVMLEKSKLTSDGKAPIFIRLTVEGKRSEISLGQKVLAKDWNPAAGQVKGSSQEARIINNNIDMAKVRLRQHYDLLSINNDFVSASMVKKAYQGKPEKTKGLMEVIGFAIERIHKKVENGKRAKATLTKWNTTKDKAASFIKHSYKDEDLPLNKLALSFAEDFIDLSNAGAANRK